MAASRWRRPPNVTRVTWPAWATAYSRKGSSRSITTVEQLTQTPRTMPHAEVAELRGQSTRTVNRELLKARALLQELLGDAPNTVY